MVVTIQGENPAWEKKQAKRSDWFHISFSQLKTIAILSIFKTYALDGGLFKKGDKKGWFLKSLSRGLMTSEDAAMNTSILNRSRDIFIYTFSPIVILAILCFYPARCLF